jgi:hypothetical protein
VESQSRQVGSGGASGGVIPPAPVTFPRRRAAPLRLLPLCLPSPSFCLVEWEGHEVAEMDGKGWGFGGHPSYRGTLVMVARTLTYGGDGWPGYV